MDGVYKKAGKTYADMVLPGMTPDEIGYRKVKLIFEVFNEGWIVDYDNPNQDKYEIRWIKNENTGRFSCRLCRYGWSADTVSGARLVGKSLPICKHIGKYFEPEFNEFLQ